MNSTTNISRRGFVKGAAAAGITAGAIGTQAALAGEAETETALPKAIDISEVPADCKELTADIVVVGGGGAGIAAVAQGAELGLTSVVFEKTSLLGGTFACAGGIFAVDSHLQDEMGISEEINALKLWKESMEFSHYMADPFVVKNFLAMSGPNIEWLEDKGVEFAKVYATGISYKTVHEAKVDIDDPIGKNQAISDALLKYIDGTGLAQFLIETTVEQVIVENGSVVGVLACDNATGEMYKATGVGVVMASGGFIGSPELIRKYTSYDPDFFFNAGTAGRTGDGISMGGAAGAALHGMEALMVFGGIIPELWTAQTRVFDSASTRSPFLWLNEKGRRFTDESNVFNFSYSGNAISHQKALYTFYDEPKLAYMEENGGYYDGYPIGDGRAVIEELDADPTCDYVFKADSWEEMAEKTGLDKDTLLEEVARYNQMCYDGVDADFGKESYLDPVDTPPFYGFKCHLGVYTSVGGLKVNDRCEVVTPAGEVISGLYAAGTDAGGLYGDTYDVSVCAASAAGFSMCSGRRCAMSIAEKAGQQA